MILLDSNVLVGLVDPRDSRHVQAAKDLDKLGKNRLVISLPVMTECLHFLPRKDQRMLLRRLIHELPLEILDHSAFPSIDEVLEWSIRYASHEPDFADAFLVCASGKNRAVKVWTYDSEFRTIWRRPDGSAVPMAVKPS